MILTDLKDYRMINDGIWVGIYGHLEHGVGRLPCTRLDRKYAPLEIGQRRVWFQSTEKKFLDSMMTTIASSPISAAQ